MKKVLIVCAALTMLVLGSCGKKVRCVVCGEPGSCDTVEKGGVEYNVCGDCKKDFK